MTSRSCRQKSSSPRWGQWATRRTITYSIALPLLFLAMSVGGIGEGFRRYALLILGFSLIIFIHELGHFVVARLCSVKCETFSIGIGPRMLGWRKGIGFSFGNEPGVENTTVRDTIDSVMHGDMQQEDHVPTTAAKLKPPQIEPVVASHDTTDYRISWLPLGGYVRMLGQDDMDPTAISSDPRAFNNRPIWQRMCIISAGVVMNIIFAAIIFAVVFHVGIEFPPAQVGMVLYNSPADKAGLQIGDMITAINGYKPREGFLEFMDLSSATALSSPGEKVSLDIQRGDKQLEKELLPEAGPNGLLGIGVGPMMSLKIPQFTAEEKADLATEMPEFAKFRSGDRVTAVNGVAISTYPEFFNRLQASNGQPLKITLTNSDPKLGSIDLTMKPTLGARPGVDDLTDLLGLSPRVTAEKVMPGDPAETAGMKDGDIIIRVGETAYPTMQEFRNTIEKNAGKTLNLVVLRDNKPQNLTVKPVDRDNVGRIGVALTMDFDHPVISAREESGAFASVPRGSSIISVNNQSVKNWDDLVAIARANSGKTLTFEFQDPQGAVSHVDVAIGDAQQNELAKLEYHLPTLPLEPLVQVQRSDSFTGAVGMGLAHTRSFIEQTYATLRGLVLRTVPTSELHGPLGIAKIGHDVQERGFIWLLFILGVVSVNLAVANFLPLPIVDGGLFVLLIIEKLRGRPLPPKILNAINMAGLFLLVGLFLFVTFNNDLRLFLHGS